MALRTAHGTARECGQTVVVEVPPADELHPIAPEVAPAQRRGRGFGRPFTKDTARDAGAKGGRRKGETAAFHRALDSLGLSSLKVSPKNEPILRDAEALLRTIANQTARHCGGRLSAAASSILLSAVYQRTAEALLFADALEARGRGDAEGAADLFMKARQAGDSHRNNLLGAHHKAELDVRAEDALRKRLTIDGTPRGSDEEALARRKAEEAAALGVAAE